MKIQRQLDENYRSYVFLRDPLISATTSRIEKMKNAVKRVPPKSSSEAKDIIGSYLSSEPGSAGNYVENKDVGL